jgi:two-component system sensor histidine kinase UhpB
MEIHDHLNASLIGLRAKAERIADLASALEPADQAAEICDQVTDITKTIEGLYVSARSLQKQLRPEVIDILGLTGAIRELTRDYQTAKPEIGFELRIDDDFPDLRNRLAITAFRLVQEALSNVVKHSRASRVTVRLKWPHQRPIVVVGVVDDGIGFDEDNIPHDRLGLVGMKERAKSVGGDMKINARPGRGTAIMFFLPLAQDPDTQW